MAIPGYAGKILRVDLTNERIWTEELEEATLRRYLGGSALGAKYHYEEVPPGVAWSDPENRLIWASGPLGGTKMGGSGTFSVVTKGPLTDGATSTQANGFMAAYMKFAGFDAIIVQGAARDWVYLYLHDGGAELRDARHLLGKGTWQVEEAIKEELGMRKRALSVFGIGPAGENLVRFAAIVGDEGHLASHNGTGAVMGSKRLKAVAAARGRSFVPVQDQERLSALAKQALENIKTAPGIDIYRWGTSQVYSGLHSRGGLPTKNYTTSLFPNHARFMGENVRSCFKIKLNPCWACQMHHCHLMEVTEGPYAGFVGEEPEYEGWASWGSLIGQEDPGAAVMLSYEAENLGMDCNEAGWLIALLMECYEKGVIGKEDLDGIEMTWGNVEATRAMLRKIAHLEGCGDIFAEGVKRAAEKIGGQALVMGIYTQKGNTPRGHDHRAMWSMLFDTCVSDMGTDEGSSVANPEELGLEPVTDPFSPGQVATMNAKAKAPRLFEDSLGTCSFNTRGQIGILSQIVAAATGWDFTLKEAIEVGERAVNLLRAFNTRHGHTPQLEVPSARYGSTPIDGPAAGNSILPHWDEMLDIYYRELGWDRETGRPLPETLRRLGLDNVIADIWEPQMAR